MQARCAVMRKMLLILRGMVIADKKYDKNFKKILKKHLTFSKPSIWYHELLSKMLVLLLHGRHVQPGDKKDMQSTLVLLLS